MDKRGRRIVYLSGPITGTDDYMERFARAAGKVPPGYRVINPAEVMAKLPDLTHKQYMKICLAMLSCADVIYMMRGWEKSEGARQEYRFALDHGMNGWMETEGGG